MYIALDDEVNLKVKQLTCWVAVWQTGGVSCNKVYCFGSGAYAALPVMVFHLPLLWYG